MISMVLSMRFSLHPSAMLAIISCIAASILVTLSGICERPKGPLKGALIAVATPFEEKRMEKKQVLMGRYGGYVLIWNNHHPN